MKRKIIISLFVLLLVFLITGCKNSNESSETNYYYSYDGTYASVGPANYMPTIVSSAPVYETYSLVGENTFTQSDN